MFRKTFQPDLSLIGGSIMITALSMFYGLHLSPEHSGLARFVCQPLVWLFGDFAVMITLIMFQLGAFLSIEADDLRFFSAFGYGAGAYLMIFSTIYKQGHVGKWFDFCLHSWYTQAPEGVAYFEWALFAVLTYAMSGISARWTLLAFARWLWNARLPAAVFCRDTTEEEAAEEAVLVSEEAPAPQAQTFEASTSLAVIEVTPKHPEYTLPDCSLLTPPVPPAPVVDNRDGVLMDMFASHNVKVRIVKIQIGPSTTRYEIAPERGVKVGNVTKLKNDIAMALAAAEVRIEAPIPGKSVIGIEFANKSRTTVTLREMVEAMPKNKSRLLIAMGKDIYNTPIYADISKMPHVIVAGATGAGKSVWLNSMIASLLMTCTPDEVQMLMIDPKRVELTPYNGIPHLRRDVITDKEQGVGALLEIAREMDARYARFEACAVKHIGDYNKRNPANKLPYIVVIIDEFADLVKCSQKTEIVIDRLASLARATGIHLVIATQRPSVDVITGIIKANIPSRIAFAVSSQTDSRCVMDANGAELLLGMGDLLFQSSEAPHPVRMQGAFCTNDEIQAIVDFWRDQATPRFVAEAPVISYEDPVEQALIDAARFVVAEGAASTNGIRKRFRVSHEKALAIMQQLETLAIVSQHEGTKPRKVLMNADQLAEIIGREEVCLI